MKSYIEIQRGNVTLAQFFTYIKAQCKKKGLEFWLDRGDFENPYAPYNVHYYVKDGIKYFATANGYQESDGTDAACQEEICRTLPLTYQTYIKNFDGSCYNEICEFTFDNDRRGHGYYYQCNVDANATTVMEVWHGCTELEAWAAMELNTQSLQETRRSIAEAVTYQRILDNSYAGNVQFLREEYYKGKAEAAYDDFIQESAREMSEEQAHGYVYISKLVDDYAEMSETEISAVLWGSDAESEVA